MPPIDSKAIVDGNLNLILGLVWVLILHYCTPITPNNPI